MKWNQMKSGSTMFHELAKFRRGNAGSFGSFRNEVPEARKDGSELRKIAFAEATEAVAWLRVICGW